MSSSRHQAVIDAPVEVIWELVGDPNRHGEWWPAVIESECPDLEQGCSYRTVMKGPLGQREEHEILVEKLDDCREVLIRCIETGVWCRWVLTQAQGRTFVDAEFGAEPTKLGARMFDRLAGRRFFRRWLQQSVDALEAAAAREAGSAIG